MTNEIKVVLSWALALVIIGCLLFWGIRSNIALKDSNKLNDIIIGSAKERIANDKKQAQFEIKQSEVRYDSILKVHLLFIDKSKKNKLKLNTQLNEIKKFTPSTRSVYLDSLFRANGIR